MALTIALLKFQKSFKLQSVCFLIHLPLTSTGPTIVQCISAIRFLYMIFNSWNCVLSAFPKSFVVITNPLDRSILPFSAFVHAVVSIVNVICINFHIKVFIYSSYDNVNYIPMVSSFSFLLLLINTSYKISRDNVIDFSFRRILQILHPRNSSVLNLKYINTYIWFFEKIVKYVCPLFDALVELLNYF